MYYCGTKISRELTIASRCDSIGDPLEVYAVSAQRFEADDRLFRHETGHVLVRILFVFRPQPANHEASNCSFFLLKKTGLRSFGWRRPGSWRIWSWPANDYGVLVWLRHRHLWNGFKVFKYLLRHYGIQQRNDFRISTGDAMRRWRRSTGAYWKLLRAGLSSWLLWAGLPNLFFPLERQWWWMQHWCQLPLCLQWRILRPPSP